LVRTWWQSGKAQMSSITSDKQTAALALSSTAILTRLERHHQLGSATTRAANAVISGPRVSLGCKPGSFTDAVQIPCHSDQRYSIHGSQAPLMARAISPAGGRVILLQQLNSEALSPPARRYSFLPSLPAYRGQTSPPPVEGHTTVILPQRSVTSSHDA
jgi:hypothetical protein